MRNDEGRERQTVKQRLHTSPPETPGGADSGVALEEKGEEAGEGGGSDAGASAGAGAGADAALLQALPTLFGEFMTTREQELRGQLGGAVGKADTILAAADAEIACWRLGAAPLSRAMFASGQTNAKAARDFWDDFWTHWIKVKPTDHRPQSIDHRLLTADCRPPTADHRPLTGRTGSR